MDIRTIFDSKASQLFWHALPNGHVLGGISQQPCEPGQSYFVIRVTEMYLNSCRKLWKLVYPLIHAYVETGGARQHVITGPGQLSALGDANLDRLTDLDQLLTGPTPYFGGDVNLLAGLYSVPGHDFAKVLIDTTATLAALAFRIPPQALPIAGLVKSCVESLVGIDTTTLHLGIQCTFGSASCPLVSGYWACIAAPESSVDVNQLWLKEGRLCKGVDAGSAKVYADHDFMVIAVERLPQRTDWRTLPVMIDFASRFGKIAGDPGFSADEKRKRFADLWPVFQQALADSPDLVDSDRKNISQTVAADLLQRLDSQGTGNPFAKI